MLEMLETHMAIREQQNNSELMNFKKIRSNSEQSRFTTPRSLIKH